MEIQTSVLSNGLKLIHQKVKDAPIYHCGIFINVGSRDERKEERGVAHFLEHLLFKGTSNRRAYHVISRLDSVGGELNAYTTKEETVVYASVLKKHTDRALDIIADVVFNSTFPELEIEKEKEVVLDEILSYQDAPAELIFEDFDRALYGENSLGNDVLGNAKEVKNISRSTILNFVDKFYRPENMVLSSVGDFDIKLIERKVEKYFSVKGNTGNIITLRKEPSPLSFKQQINKDIFQSHLLIGAPACSYMHRDRTALVLLNNYLGGPGMNSRLNLEVRENGALAYNVDSSLHNFSDSGAFVVYCGCDSKNLIKAKRVIYREIKKLHSKELSPQALQKAKEQLKGFMALGMESKVGLMLGLGKAHLLSDKVDSVEESFARIDKVSAQDLKDVANRYLKKENLSELSYLSQNSN